MIFMYFIQILASMIAWQMQFLSTFRMAKISKILQGDPHPNPRRGGGALRAPTPPHPPPPSCIVALPTANISHLLRL